MLFDDKTFEQIHPPSLLADGPVAAASLWHQGAEGASKDWRRCMVLEYRADDEMFLIEWDENKKRKWASRLNVRFDSEDPESFDRRRAVALEQRARLEAIMRYDNMIDNMPAPPRVAYSGEVLQGVINRVGATAARGVSTSHGFVGALEAHYVRMINRMEFDALNPNADPNLVKDPVVIESARNGVQRPDLFKLARGTVDTVAHEFNTCISTIERSMCWMEPHMLRALYAIQLQVTKYARRGSRPPNPPPPLRLLGMKFLWAGREALSLDDFLLRQTDQLEIVVSDVNSSVVDVMADAILGAYSNEDSSNGIRDDRKALYMSLTNLANKMLNDAIRSAVLESLRLYVARFVSYLRPDAARFQDEALPQEVEEGLDVPGLNSPVFNLTLTVVNGALAFAPPLDVVQRKAVAVIGEVIAALPQISTVSVSLIDPSGSSSKTPPAITGSDPAVVKAIADVNDVFKDNLAGPAALVRSFEQFRSARGGGDSNRAKIPAGP
jgi:hypothetical protein